MKTSKNHRSKRPSGFTLVEVIVVTTIIAVLATFVFLGSPSMTAATFGGGAMLSRVKRKTVKIAYRHQGRAVVVF